jgi:hypothetical protein
MQYDLMLQREHSIWTNDYHHVLDVAKFDFWCHIR